jgi:ribose 5-phosphate isomerase B
MEYPMKAWKIVMASDHAGLALKLYLRGVLEKRGCTVVDVGTHTEASCDYPDYAAEAGRRLAAGEFERGVFVCGTGVGVSISANKIPGLRAVTATSELVVELSRKHNDANVLCLGKWILGETLAEALVCRFLETGFEEGRHLLRLAKIRRLESDCKS